MRLIELTDGSQVTAAQFRAQNPRVQYGGEFPAVAYLETIGAYIVTVAPPPKYATASEAKLAMTGWINNLTAQIQDEYPDVVQKGWIEEEAMATAFTAGTESAQQLAVLTADATSKGRTPAEHAARILEKAQAFRSIALQTRNLWLSVDKALDDATPDQFEAILQGAIAQAAPLAVAFGLRT